MTVYNVCEYEFFRDGTATAVVRRARDNRLCAHLCLKKVDVDCICASVSCERRFRLTNNMRRCIEFDVEKKIPCYAVYVDEVK